MQMKLILAFFLISVVLSSSKMGFMALNDGENAPEAKMPFTEYCGYYNYPVENHTITTEDGYILTFFRIQAKYSTIVPGLPVVYLQHGLLDSSDTWIINSEPLAPGFIFANRGYDVWLGNSRGNKWAMAHVNMSSSDKAFWQFDWDGMAQYDLPAAFTYIANYTSKKINYVGHSEGTTIMFAALSLAIPAIVDNIICFMALGPVTYLDHTTSNIMYLLANTQFDDLIVETGTVDFLPPNWATTTFGIYFCKYFPHDCEDIIAVIADMDPKDDNYERMDVIMGHEPGGTSTQNMFHWKQMLMNHTYAMYDYGTAENWIKYKQATPPAYNLSNIFMPVSMFVGTQDKLADVLDAEALRGNLTNSASVFWGEYPLGHMSFVWGVNESYLNDVFNQIDIANNQTFLLKDAILE
jgi:gastric triacylglycerol lipase